MVKLTPTQPHIVIYILASAALLAGQNFTDAATVFCGIRQTNAALKIAL